MNAFHQAQLFKEYLIVTIMTLSVKWKEEHFLQRHHTCTTFVDRANIGDRIINVHRLYKTKKCVPKLSI